MDCVLEMRMCNRDVFNKKRESWCSVAVQPQGGAAGLMEQLSSGVSVNECVCVCYSESVSCPW